MTDFLYYTTIVTFRVPILAGGGAGQPEVLKSFTMPSKGTQELKRKKGTSFVKVESVTEVEM